jgi:hypothetical protein
MELTINTPIEASAAALATAAALPMTAFGEETLTLIRDLAQIAHHLSELTEYSSAISLASGAVAKIQRASRMPRSSTASSWAPGSER